MRVRSMQMNDAHIYCSEEQFETEFLGVVNMYLEYFRLFDIEKYVMRLSTHHRKGLGKKYVDNERLWLKTEEMVRSAMRHGNVPFVEVPDEAAIVVISRHEVLCAQLRVEQLGEVVWILIPVVEGERRWIVPACDCFCILLRHWSEMERQALTVRPARHGRSEPRTPHRDGRLRFRRRLGRRGFLQPQGNLPASPLGPSGSSGTKNTAKTADALGLRPCRAALSRRERRGSHAAPPDSR